MNDRDEAADLIEASYRDRAGDEAITRMIIVAELGGIAVLAGIWWLVLA